MNEKVSSLHSPFPFPWFWDSTRVVHIVAVWQIHTCPAHPFFFGAKNIISHFFGMKVREFHIRTNGRFTNGDPVSHPLYAVPEKCPIVTQNTSEEYTFVPFTHWNQSHSLNHFPKFFSINCSCVIFIFLHWGYKVLRHTLFLLQVYKLSLQYTRFSSQLHESLW